ncbi:MAG TPA: hypothetical protein VH877_19090 [Polyangia bacterium]|jgi:hypothetical protein|nr:hypothetical protein [Polyangia bacterium]
MKRVVIAVFCLATTGNALAQKKEAKQPSTQAAPAEGTPARPTYYDFDGDEVEGRLVGPDQTPIDSLIKKQRKSLVMPRSSFVNEMIRSAESV